MNIALIIGVATGVVGVIGITYTIYYGRRSQRKKLMVYEVSKPVALAQAFSPEGDYKLSVLFQRKGSIEEKIESVHTTFLKFANLGKESIRGSDIATANPLKVTIKGDRVLDIQLAGITREVNNVSLRNQVTGDEQASAYINFDFLDYQDGALLKILSVGNKGDISIEGDIIGMPEGINSIDKLRQKVKPKDVMYRFPWIIGLLIASFILSVFVCYWTTGNWGSVWLIFLPIGVSLILVVLFVIIVNIVLSLRGGLSFPSGLDLPRWTSAFAYPMYIMKVGSLRGLLYKVDIQEAVTSENGVKQKENERSEN